MSRRTDASVMRQREYRRVLAWARYAGVHDVDTALVIGRLGPNPDLDDLRAALEQYVPDARLGWTGVAA